MLYLQDLKDNRWFPSQSSWDGGHHLNLLTGEVTCHIVNMNGKSSVLVPIYCCLTNQFWTQWLKITVYDYLSWFSRLPMVTWVVCPWGLSCSYSQVAAGTGDPRILLSWVSVAFVSVCGLVFSQCWSHCHHTCHLEDGFQEKESMICWAGLGLCPDLALCASALSHLSKPSWGPGRFKGVEIDFTHQQGSRWPRRRICGCQISLWPLLKEAIYYFSSYKPWESPLLDKDWARKINRKIKILEQM